ncbi:MAG: transposase [Ardenticatenaceae bacterium]|nr:transposase [Ardenticatenaceae bacterium]
MSQNQKPIRSRVHRVYVPEAVYFITTNVQDRQNLFATDKSVALLRQTMREAKKFHPFQMRAYAFMPDHFHLLICLLALTNISNLLQSIKRNFTRNYKALYGIGAPLRLWQRSFYDHVIRDERDYLNHLHYIHYNPVKHGYVTRPEDYPHTSYREYLRRGWYEVGWGYQEEAEWVSLYHEA